jgi:hypothetical protein
MFENQFFKKEKWSSKDRYEEVPKLTPASAVSGVVDKTRLQFTGSPV